MPIERPAPPVQKTDVDTFHESVKSEGVKIDLPGLMKRIKALTTKPGSKGKLATRCGVPLGSLSQWLSGKREPGGAITLKLLNWVEAEEAKQK